MFPWLQSCQRSEAGSDDRMIAYSLLSLFVVTVLVVAVVVVVAITELGRCLDSRWLPGATIKS